MSVETIYYVHEHVIPAALSMLPAKMTSGPARAMMLAIGLQESRFDHRVQVGGPAHGYWQFEKGGGIRGVMKHPSTHAALKVTLDTLDYRNASETELYNAVIHNDVLAAVFARLLLWSSPIIAPQWTDVDLGWKLYYTTWRPGKPHPETWGAHFARAWNIIKENEQ